MKVYKKSAILAFVSILIVCMTSCSNPEEDFKKGESLMGEGKTKEGIELIEKAAKNGSTKAMVKLGENYNFGYGVKRDDKKAYELFKKAADKGDAEGLFKLGVCYSQGYSVPRDDAKAYEFFQQAADKGSTNGMCAVGGRYERANFMERDAAKKEFNRKKAVEYYEMAGMKGNAYGYAKLGELYANRELNGVEPFLNKDEKKGFEFDLKAADMGDPASMFIVATAYEKGIGTAVDGKKAFEYYKKAADCHHGIAFKAGIKIGDCYRDGIGVAKDEKKYFECCKHYAATRDADSMMKLGICYRDGVGVEKDEAKAKEWLDKAAAKGAVLPK